MKKILITFLLFLSASAASATFGLVSCTAGMVSGGFCASTAESLLYISHLRLDPDSGGPLTGWDEISAAICARANYQSVIADPENPGQTIPNPQSCNQFAIDQVREWLRSTVREYRASQDNATQPSRVQPAPEVGQ